MANFYKTIHDNLVNAPEKEFIIFPSSANDNASVIYTGQSILSLISGYRRRLEEKLSLIPGDKVLLDLPVGIELVGVLLALMSIGAIPVLPPVNASPSRTYQIMRQQKITAVVKSDSSWFPLSLFGKGMGFKLLIVGKTKLLEGNSIISPNEVSSDQVALISFSSGTTGKPRPVYRSHQVLLAQHNVLKQIFPPFEGQRDFPLFPIIFLHNLAAGTISIVPDLPWKDMTIFSPERIIAQMFREQINTLTGNVYYFNQLVPYMQKNNVTLPQVQALIIGGSPVPEHLAQALRKCFPNARVSVTYGSAEAEPIAVREVRQESPAYKGFAVGSFVDSLEWRINPLGQLYFRDGNAFDVGEIEVRGPHVATASANSWLPTGDFGYVGADGQLYLTGRRGNEQLHNGVQHYQLEHVLQQLPGIERVAARSLEWGFCIYLQGKIKEAIVRNEILKALPASIVNRVHVRKALPVDARHHSKILYTSLF